MDEFKTQKIRNSLDNLTAPPMLTERSVSHFPSLFQNPHKPYAYGFSIEDHSDHNHHSAFYDQPNVSIQTSALEVNQSHIRHGQTSGLQFADRGEVLPYQTYQHLIPCDFAATNGHLSTVSPSTHFTNKQSSCLETTSSNVHVMKNSRQLYPEKRIQHDSQLIGTNHYKQPSEEYGGNALLKIKFFSSIDQQETTPPTGMKSHIIKTVENHASLCKPISNSKNHEEEIPTGVNDLVTKMTSLKAYFRCGICELKLSSNEALLGHVNTHTDFMPYSCSLCGFSFIEGQQLIRHVQYSHSVKAPYACGLCNQTFYENFELEQHVLSHNEYKTNTDSNLEKEDSRHSALDEGNLDMSTKEDDIEVENYKAIVEDGSDSCNSSIPSNTIIISKDTRFDVRKEPSKIVMDDIDFESVCTVIIEPSSAGGIRKKHLFKCNFCEKICKDKGSLVSHVRTHTKGRPYECHICSAKFKQYAHLSDHMMTKHSKDRPYVCDRCAKSFNRKSHLQDHIRLKHTKDKLYHCPECPLVFEKRADFSEHKSAHAKKLKHQCNMCSRQFRNVTDYERHIRSHTKEKPFECEICHLKFGLLANAKKHMVKHSKEKPFKCDICPKAYHFERDLKRHTVTHLKKKPFPCSECYKSFKNAALLKKHFNISHLKNKLKSDRFSKTLKQTKFACSSITKEVDESHSESNNEKTTALNNGSHDHLQTDLINFANFGEENGNSKQKTSMCIPSKRRGRLRKK